MGSNNLEAGTIAKTKLLVNSSPYRPQKANSWIAQFKPLPLPLPQKLER